jgi:hypothetical protein
MISHKLFCAQASDKMCEKMLCIYCKILYPEIIAYLKNKGKPVRAAADARYREKHRKELAANNIARYRKDPTIWENYRKNNRESINKKARKRYAEKKVAQSNGN